MDKNPDPMSQFVTNVGLITSRGVLGDNIMACEWTHHISYEPELIIVAIRKGKTTYDNILASNEFGVSIASIDQNWVSSTAGNSHGVDYDKVGAMSEMGVEFYEAEKIKTLMVSGSSANLECKLVQYIDIGDHPIFIGEVVKQSKTDKKPILYHLEKYFHLGERVTKTPQEMREKRKAILEKYKRK